MRFLWSDLPIRRRGALIIAIPVACLLTSVATFAALQSGTAKVQKYINQTQQVIQQANRLLTALVDAETGVRGYALTYAVEYLEPYNNSLTEIPNFLGQLSHLVEKNPQQLQQVRRIYQLTQRKMQIMKDQVNQVNAVQQGTAESFMWQREGKVTMDALRQQITEFRTQQETLLNQRASELKSQQQITIGVLAATATVGILGSIAAVYLFDHLDWELAERQTRLRESNIRTQAILDNVVDGIITINEQGHIESFNQGAQQMFGYEPTQVIGQNLRLLIIDSQLGDSLQTLSYFVGKNQSKIRRLQETMGRRQNGTTFPVEIAFNQIQLDNQQLFIGILRDISQRKQAEETLRKQAQLLDLANDTIIVRDQNDRITYWNQGAERLYGWSKEEALGQPIYTLLKTEFPINPAEIQDIFLQEGYWKGELVQTERNGKQIIVASRWTLQTDDEGEPIATLEINYDITDRKAAEQALVFRASELAELSTILAKTNADLEKRNQELDQFAYIVSHDLKAPLRAIANLSTWIEEDISDQLNPETRHQMDLLRGRVYRMESLINALLQYSRVGRVKGSAEWVNIHTLVSEIIDTLAPPPHFTFTIAPNMPTLLTERLPLEQVFTNLIGNAIKHNPQMDGQVTISVQNLEDFYEFAVADNGLGIAPHYHEKVFVMFQTLEARDKVENTGVGLAIVKKIIENQGGSIHVESQIGEGAKFYFTWPKEPIQPS